MKKIIFVIMLLIPLSVFAYSGPLDADTFYINNQTNTPYHITINSNSYVDSEFHLVWTWYHAGNTNIDLPGSYLFFSVVSDKKIDINRKNNFGVSCNQSCFSNDDYLQLVDDTNGYSYVYYFNIVKWAINVGTQVDLYNVDDYFRFTNKESGTANVYVYGVYSDTTNQIPQYINNANTTQQIIIDGQTNAEWIIENQTQNTQEIIDNLNDCNDKSMTNIDGTNNSALNSNGGIESANGFVVTPYIKINPEQTYTLTRDSSWGTGRYYCTYNNKKNLIGCYVYGNSTSFNITGANYIRYTWSTTGNRYVTLSGYMCENKIDNTTNAVNDVNNSINNSDIDNPNSDLSDISDMVAENGVITQLIVLPITLYTAVLNTINGQCNDYVFGSLFGTELKMTCVNVSNLLGSTLYNTIDIIISGLFVFGISKKMIKVFNNMSSLKEGDVIGD